MLKNTILVLAMLFTSVACGDNEVDADEDHVVDLDAFTTTAEQVAALHAQGRKVIAYISAGTIENDRPDGVSRFFGF